MNAILSGTLNLIIYFIIAVVIAFGCRILFTIPDEIFRKALHFILLGSFLVLLVSYPTWQITAIAAIIFEVLVYPILKIAERIKQYSSFTTEGTSLGSFFFMYNILRII